jgi:hypothetical protein
MRKMTSTQAKAFRNRWQAVSTAEMEERREASLELRWRQLNALWRLAAGLGLLPEEAEGVQEVRERWVRLKEDCT